MDQMTFSEAEYQNKRHKTRREIFLERMDKLIPWKLLEKKDSTGKRDRIAGPPEMHQTMKGNEWHFGMRMHIGVDDTLGLIHSIDTTAANVHDIVPAGKLLHGEEQRVFGDAGYPWYSKAGGT